MINDKPVWTWGKSGYEMSSKYRRILLERQRSVANNHYTMKSINWSDIISVALNHQTGYLPAKGEEVFFCLNSLFVTICPETFSNRCVDSVRDMQEIRTSSEVLNRKD